jgi:hypothetical protein
MRKPPISYATLAGTAARAPLALMLGGAVIGMSSVVSHASSAGGTVAGGTAAASPQVIAATQIGPQPGSLRPGTVVASRRLGVRAFADGQHGFALASTAQAQYPAATSNGGGVWRIDGPPLHLNAAQAPLVVLQVGVANSRTFFAYGGPGGGQVVDVTNDGGHQWWRAVLGEVVLAVVAGPGAQLTAVAQSSTTSGASALTSVYVSSDGGRHWRYDARLGAG